MPPKLNEQLVMRIAVESQLLGEEKWIIDALKKIKKQRNCLQIEKLHLENLKSRLKIADQKSSLESGASSPVASQSSALDMMQNPAGSHVSTEVPSLGLDDETCNFEELNLAVTNSVFVNTDSISFDTEEEEEDIENCVIPMNMFMYSKQSKGQTGDDKSDD